MRQILEKLFLAALAAIILWNLLQALVLMLDWQGIHPWIFGAVVALIGLMVFGAIKKIGAARFNPHNSDDQTT